MNILAIIKNGENKHQLRKLVDKGHTVIIKNSVEGVPYSDVDVVVSLSDLSVEDAFNISQRYNIPFYAHMDWIPPWMVFKDSEYNWGYIDKIPYAKKMNFIRKYQNIAMYWSMADVKSMSANCFHEQMKELIGIPDLTIFTRYPRPDIGEINKFNNKEIIIHDKITCVSRFLPHKRIHHLIKALQMIEYEGTLVLIGSGEDKNLYDAIKGDLDIQYASALDKYEIVASSRLVVSLWNATVALEAMTLGTPVIAYESDYMKEICGDNISYVTNNSISELARGIKHILLSEQDKKTYIVNNDDILEKLIMKAVRK